jgi:hypothetical protein
MTAHSWMAAGLVTLLIGPAEAGPYALAGTDAEHQAQALPLGEDASTLEHEDLIIRATVRRVLGPRIFTVERAVADGELVVLTPFADAAPAGTTVLVRGVLTPAGEARVRYARVWNALQADVQKSMASRPILVAASLSAEVPRVVRLQPETEVRLKPDTTLASQPAQREAAARAREADETRLHPAALAQLIDELGGRQITLSKAYVPAVLNPRVFLVESGGAIPPTVGNLHRVLVLVDGGTLRVDAAALVGSNVRILGVARTLLGMQVTREVPWPPELTREILDRYEIRAAVLASSVQTADGVELIARPQ